jgi:hypothetical protein
LKFVIFNDTSPSREPQPLRPRLPAAFDRPREDFAEDFDEDFDAALDEGLPELFFDDFFDDFLPELFFDDFAPEAFFRLLRDEETSAAPLPADFGAGAGRIMSAAVGLTAPTASAAVSKAALASPAACSPA